MLPEVHTQDCSQYIHFEKKFNPLIRKVIYKIVNIQVGEVPLFEGIF